MGVFCSDMGCGHSWEDSLRSGSWKINPTLDVINRNLGPRVGVGSGCEGDHLLVYRPRSEADRGEGEREHRRLRLFPGRSVGPPGGDEGERDGGQRARHRLRPERQPGPGRGPDDEMQTITGSRSTATSPTRTAPSTGLRRTSRCTPLSTTSSGQSAPPSMGAGCMR